MDMEAALQEKTTTTHRKIPSWKVVGDWFDVCTCNIPCPCGFAQTPTYGDCHGSDVGPGGAATWGRAISDEVEVLGFKWEWNGRSSKHIPFDWSGP